MNYLPTTTKRNNVVAIFIFDPVLINNILKISKKSSNLTKGFWEFRNEERSNNW